MPHLYLSIVFIGPLSFGVFETQKMTEHQPRNGLSTDHSRDLVLPHDTRSIDFSVNLASSKRMIFERLLRHKIEESHRILHQWNSKIMLQRRIHQNINSVRWILPRDCLRIFLGNDWKTNNFLENWFSSSKLEEEKRAHDRQNIGCNDERHQSKSICACTFY